MKKLILLLIIGVLLSSCGQVSKKSKPEVLKSYSQMTKSEKMDLVLNGSKLPNGTFLSRDSINHELLEFEGKLLIIDYWATWCAPCIEESPYFEEMATKYESEEIQFLTLSVNGEYSFWRDFLLERGWEGDHHYWLGNNENAPLFFPVYKETDLDSVKAILQTFPKYIAVDKNGIILNNNFPRPSQPGFEARLKEYL